MITFAEDIKEFYYNSFICNKERCLRNSLCLDFPSHALSHLRAFHSGLETAKSVTPALATLAMGDKRAVAFAQTSHLSLALRTGQFELSDFITLRSPVNRRSWQAGLMIDDFALFAQVPASVPAGQSVEHHEALHRMSALREAYAQYGLPRHEGKSVSGDLRAEVWSSDIDGTKGLVTPSLKKAIPAMSIVVEVARLGAATVKLLEVIAGTLVSLFQYKRRFLSVLQEIYVAQRGRRDQEIVQQEPPSKTLNCCSPHSAGHPRLFRCLRDWQNFSCRRRARCPLARAFPAYIAVRALDSVAPTPPGISACIWTVGARSRAARRKLFISPIVGRGGLLPFVLGAGAQSQAEDSTTHQYPGVRALEAEKAVARLHPRTRFVQLLDSQVALGSLVKGRSASSGLNAVLRKSIADHVTSGCSPPMIM